jgi:hypothetical protein
VPGQRLPEVGRRARHDFGGELLEVGSLPVCVPLNDGVEQFVDQLATPRSA